MTATTQMHVVLSDQHIPYQDRVVEDLSIAFLKEHQPHTVHLLGDVVDFYQLSSFNKDPLRALELQGDLDSTELYLQRVRNAVPNARLILSEGNHEFRLRRYLWLQAKELCNLRSLRIEELLHLDRYNVEWVDQMSPYKIGKLLYIHGVKVSKWSAYTARAHFEKFGCCVIHGHTHRLGSFYHTDFDTTHGAWENGCCCDLKPEYCLSPDWQNGWSVVWYHGDLFHVEQIVVRGGRYVYHGELKTRAAAKRVLKSKG